MNPTASQFFALPNDTVDAATEASFYGRLKMRNGTFKLTRSARFPDVEDALAQTISSRAKDIRSVLDVGVSTGITTIEFTDFLRSVGASPQVVGTDLFIEGHIVEPLKGCRILTDQTGWALEYDIFGTPIRAWIARRDYLTGAAFVLWMTRVVLRSRLESMIAGRRSQPVRFLTARLANRADISVCANDIFTYSEEMAGSFDLVRVANVLNRSYFSDDDIGRAVDNIRAYLRPSGMFLATRTENNRGNSGTLFQLGINRKFLILARIGDGSEIEPIVL